MTCYTDKREATQMAITRKKAAVGLTSAMAAMLLLSACGSNGGSNNNNGNTASNNAPANNTSSSGSNASAEPVALNWYMVGTPQKDVDKVMEAVSAYTK